MSIVKRVLGGCLLLPVLLIGSCAGKMTFDSWRYNLPGEVLKSSVPPTQSLQSPIQVARVLDSYVQPRFEILRDKNFGAMRIVYRQHAGIVQLKVDTAEEKEKIANVNAAKHDYAISLLHCAKIPMHHKNYEGKELELLYFNQEPIASPTTFPGDLLNKNRPKTEGYDAEAVQKKAVAVLPKLMKGKEQCAEVGKWSVLMRPVLAASQECLSCHTNAKPGDTLGVMVYAVRKTTHTTPALVSLR